MYLIAVRRERMRDEESQESKEGKCILENERELREIFIGQETEARMKILLSFAK
ncbi:hypothetical protein ALC53_01898 [Atta colombica]|uniref:Uncharacterized protein n=1 Tax=Atta colombica TaxID=520822 RepID=A0A195BT33_9HYME|nr:hypothetical protein ALC53_01898 [Atta colombica]